MFIEALIGLFLLLLAWLYFREGHPMDKLPGPPRLPIIGNAHQVMNIPTDKVLDVMMDYTKKYGDRYTLIVLGQRNLHISGPNDIEILLSHTKNITKSLPYRFMSAWLGNGLLLSTGAFWHRRRKILTPTFHFNILRNFSIIIEEKSRDLVHMLKEKKGADVDIMPVVSDFTLYTICETAMGTKLDKDQSSTALEYKNDILNMGLLLLSRVTKFWLWADFMFNQSAPGKQFAKHLATARSFADNVIVDRKVRSADDKIEKITEDTDFGTKKRLAMLNLLLEAEAKGEIDMNGIRDEVNTFMFEGHDTTTLGITYALMLLAEHEDVQERVYEEIRSILGDSDRELTMSDLSNMKYLEAVIKRSVSKEGHCDRRTHI